MGYEFGEEEDDEKKENTKDKILNQYYWMLKIKGIN